MAETFYNYVALAYSNPLMSLLFLVLPVLVNSIFYLLHLWGRVQEDRATVAAWRHNVKEAKASRQTSLPTLNDYNFVTLGTVFWCLFLTFIPIVNAIALVCDSGPAALRWLAKKLSWMFDFKLVRPKE